LFLKAVFRAIHIDKLADMVRRPFSEYRITSDTEDLCVSLLSEVRGISDGFEFDGAAAYKAALHQKLAIVDDSDHEPVMMRVKYSEVRRALRTKHDQDRFEAWFRALKAGPVFSGGRDRWQPARSRVGYSELTGNRS
jgi:hypothetical protein